MRGLPVPANAAGASYMSPRMKARMKELGLHAADLAGVAGSGAAGRVTIQDFEKFIANLEKQKITQASSMRVAVADAMRRSWTRPLAHVGLPVCLDPLFAHRKVTRPKPGPALYALRALAVALAENSAPAGRLVGNKIVHPSAIDIGFRRRSRGRRAGARDSQRGQTTAEGLGRGLTTNWSNWRANASCRRTPRAAPLPP